MKPSLRIASLALSILFASGAALADVNIGVSMSQFDDTYLTYLRESMNDKAKTYPEGVKLQFEDARADVVKQLSQVENFISQKVDAIIQPGGYRIHRPYYQSCGRRGHPVDIRQPPPGQHRSAAGRGHSGLR